MTGRQDARKSGGRLHTFFTRTGAAFGAAPKGSDGRSGRDRVMAGLAMIMFVALFAFGSDYFGWSDTGGRVQLALASSFVFGIICGFKVKD